MNLAKGDERPRPEGTLWRRPPSPAGSTRARQQLPQECGTVALDHGPRIIIGKSEIEIAFPVGPRKPSNTRGEAVDQPWQRVQLASTKNLDAGTSATGLRRPSDHMSILQEGSAQKARKGDRLWQSDGRCWASVNRALRRASLAQGRLTRVPVAPWVLGFARSVRGPLYFDYV